MNLLDKSEFLTRLQLACGQPSVASSNARRRPVTIATHISPDPDAIGSAFAMFDLCKSFGADPLVYLPERLPEKFRNLVGDRRWTSQFSEAKAEVLVVVDTATRKRTGEALDAGLPDFLESFNLDHHVSNPLWASNNYVDGTAAASALLVFELFELSGVPLAPQTANLLYAGILDDTGCFCFSNSSESAFAAAARLRECGAEPESVSNAIYFSVPERILRLQAKALQSLEMWFSGQVSVIVVPRQMLQETGCSQEETEGLVDFARKIEGAKIALFMRELEGAWKISLRSKSPEYDVNLIASQFGGGGHTAAAGATILGTLPEVQDRLKEALRSVV